MEFLEKAENGNFDIWHNGSFVHSCRSGKDVIDYIAYCSVQSEIRLVGCMVCTSARQNFDGDAVASSRNFNDAMVQNRRFTSLISGRIEHYILNMYIDGDPCLVVDEVLDTCTKLGGEYIVLMYEYNVDKCREFFLIESN